MRKFFQQLFGFRMKLVKKEQILPGVFTFTFKAPYIAQWKPGQHYSFILLHKKMDKRGPFRLFTNSAAPQEGVVQITTRIQEKDGSSFKRALHEMDLGKSVWVNGPVGIFTLKDPSAENVFLAGGIGITPFRSILADLAAKNQPSNITLLYANRSEEIPFKAEIDSYSAKGNLAVKYITSPDRITAETITGSVKNLKTARFYLSGPKPAVNAYKAILKELGVPRLHIKTDSFWGY